MILLDITTQTCLQKTEIIFKIIEASVTSLAIIIGGIWALVKFKIFRENKALIDFTVNLVFHKSIGGWWIVELVAYIENKGKVQHKIQEFDFEVSSLNSQDQVNISEEFGGQVYFPNLIKKGSFLPKKNRYFFIEPGLKNKYSYITKVPDNAELVIMHSWFNLS